MRILARLRVLSKIKHPVNDTIVSKTGSLRAILRTKVILRTLMTKTTTNFLSLTPLKH